MSPERLEALFDAASGVSAGIAAYCAITGTPFVAALCTGVAMWFLMTRIRLGRR